MDPSVVTPTHPLVPHLLPLLILPSPVGYLHTPLPTAAAFSSAVSPHPLSPTGG